MRARLSLLAMVLVFAAHAYGQTALPSFEVASVKQAVPGTQGGRIQFLPGARFRVTNVALSFIIQSIYGLKPYQIAGDSQWMSVIADGYAARYDIEAQAGAAATEAQMRAMVKALLADRFQLKMHTEQRQLPVYALVPAKGGVKLAPAAVDAGRGGIESVERGWLRGDSVTMDSLVQMIGRSLDRPVIDKTGFTALFAFQLTFNPGSEAAPDPDTPADAGCPASFQAIQERRNMKVEALSCPSLFTAVEQQLGLRLERQKLPVDVMVIDRVAKPSAN